jgi:putative ABC transport system permease protein
MNQILPPMKNYFKATWRNLWKNRGFSALNVAGLAVGVACASLIFLWVEDEMTFGHEVSKRHDIYRLMENVTHDGVINTFGQMPGPMAPVLTSEIAGIKNASRWSGQPSSALFTVDGKALYEKGEYVDSTFFSMINTALIHGDPERALDNMTDLVISERMALKFFGTADVIGKTMKMDNDKLFTVTGVMQNPLRNSSFQGEWFARFDLLVNQFDWLQQWGAKAAPTLVELYPDADVNLVNKRLTDLLTARTDSEQSDVFLFSMSEWHLYNHFTNGFQDGEGRIKYVKIFSIVACIILVVACINFMNLATARSEQRAKEVGVRKTLGARRRTLISQFMGESLMLAFLSVVVAVIILFLTLPAFNNAVGKELTLQWTSPWHIGFLLFITLTCGLMAGSYPAFYLSSFNPVYVLKGMKIRASAATGFIRKGLVVTQFAASIIFMIAAIIIYQQIAYTKNRDLGYDTSQVIYMDVRGAMGKNFSTIRNEIIREGIAENAAMSMNPVVRLGWYSSDNFTWQGKDPNKNVLIMTEAVTPEYISTLGMSIKEGRDFQPDAKSEGSNIIINETFAKMIGNKSPVGDIVSTGDNRMKIIGIVKDFVYDNMYSKSPMPVIMRCEPFDYSCLTIRLKASSDLASSLAKVEEVIKTYNPEYPFEYSFMDAEFDKLFKTETLAQKLAGAFGALAVFISCLGLFGLAAYTAQRRSKEIGIRKILGATVNSITTLISSDFLMLAGIAFLVAFPLAWWIMDNWLQSYEFRTPIYWWVFAGVGMLTVMIILVTVGFQTLKAALRNPTEVLRTE